MEKQLKILNDEIRTLKSDKSIKGVMLIGSVAYEKASEDSDLDIVVLCDRDEFVSKYVDNVLVEINFQKYRTMLKKLKSNPAEVYKYMYSKIIFDNGKINKLISKANEIYNTYKTPFEEMKNIVYWLSSTKIKLLSAIKNGDTKKVSYLISTNTWKVLEGVWAINNKPMPPSSLVFYKYDVLTKTPFENWFEDLFIGNDISRANAMIDIIDWIYEQ